MRIVQAPDAPCTYCGQGNTPTNDGSARRFLDLERDVNWNDPLIFCEDCALTIGGMMGLLSPDTFDKLRAEVRVAQRETHQVKTELDGLKRRATRLGIELRPLAKKTIAA